MLRNYRFWGAAIISAVLIALFLRATHPSELKDALQEVNYWYLLPALVVLFLAISARCVRWSVLMRPVAPLSPARLFPYAVIGYMANNLLPARAGEFVRAYVLDPQCGMLVERGRLFFPLGLVDLDDVRERDAGRRVTLIAGGLGWRLSPCASATRRLGR